MQHISPDWDADASILLECEKNPLSHYWLEGDSLAPPCQTAMDAVTQMIELAAPKPTDYLIDLGCGDGRIPIEASLRFNCRSAGIELEQRLVDVFNERISLMKVESSVEAVCGDILDVQLSGDMINRATIITVYLLPDAVEKIRPLLETALITTKDLRIVFNTWMPKSWAHKSKVQCGFSNNTTLFLCDVSSLSVITDNNAVIAKEETDVSLNTSALDLLVDRRSSFEELYREINSRMDNLLQLIVDMRLLAGKIIFALHFILFTSNNIFPSCPHFVSANFSFSAFACIVTRHRCHYLTLLLLLLLLLLVLMTIMLNFLQPESSTLV